MDLSEARMTQEWYLSLYHGDNDVFKHMLFLFTAIVILLVKWIAWSVDWAFDAIMKKDARRCGFGHSLLHYPAVWRGFRNNSRFLC